MDDVLLASNKLVDLETFAGEGCRLFESRGFKLTVSFYIISNRFI